MSVLGAFAHFLSFGYLTHRINQARTGMDPASNHGKGVDMSKVLLQMTVKEALNLTVTQDAGKLVVAAVLDEMKVVDLVNAAIPGTLDDMIGGFLKQFLKAL